MTAAAPILPLERPPSLTAMVTASLRRGIVEGRYALGEQLSEVTVAAQLGVSRTPVREAFLALKEQGLVEIRPQRGTFVFSLTKAEFQALADLRCILELGALELAMARDAQALARRLAVSVEAMRVLEAVALNDSLAHDTSFHAILIDATDNPWLVEAAGSIAGRIEAIRQRWQSRHGDVRRIARDHGQIVAAIAAGDLAAARGLLGGHIRRSAVSYQALLDA